MRRHTSRERSVLPERIEIAILPNNDDIPVANHVLRNDAKVVSVHEFDYIHFSPHNDLLISVLSDIPNVTVRDLVENTGCIAVIT